MTKTELNIWTDNLPSLFFTDNNKSTYTKFNIQIQTILLFVSSLIFPYTTRNLNVIKL
jgi:hypothetical protein